jgi:hypothetical protein
LELDGISQPTSSVVIVSLSKYVGVHAGQNGSLDRTKFDYKELVGEEPVFFINDAVALEHHLPRHQPSYMTFFDYNQRMWLTRPLDSVVLCPHEHSSAITHTSSENTIVVYQKDPDILNLTKDTLYVRRGTVCTMISFAYLTGVAKINFIGCDGINDSKLRPYDSRITNHSGGQPNWEYDTIKRCQEETCEQLGLPYRYLGTPDK